MRHLTPGRRSNSRIPRSLSIAWIPIPRADCRRFSRLSPPWTKAPRQLRINSMTTLLFVDSAYPLPQNQIPAGISGVAGYIGGDTPHTWTSFEWAAQKARYRLPVYVRSNPPGPGADVDVSAAVAQLKIIS